MRNGVFSLKALLYKMLTSNFPVENPSRHHLSEVIKVNITNGVIQKQVSQQEAMEEHSTTSDILAKKVEL